MKTKTYCKKYFTKSLKHFLLFSLSIFFVAMFSIKNKAQAQDISNSAESTEYSQNTLNLTYLETLKYTIEHHPDIASIQNKMESDQLLSSAFWKEYLPKIFTLVDHERIYNRNSIAMGDGTPRSATNLSYGLLLPVWDGLNNWYQSQAALHQSENDHWTEVTLENDLGVKVTESYIGLYMAQQEIEIFSLIDKKLKELKRTITQQIPNNKQNTILNLIDLEIQSFIAKSQQAQSHLAEQKIIFESIVGIPEKDLNPQKMQSLDEIEKIISIPSDVELAIQMIENQSPENLAAKKAIEVAENLRDAEKSPIRGNVNVYIANTSTKGNASLINPTFTDGGLIGIQGSFTLGLPTYDKIQSQKANVGTALANRASVMRSLVRDVKIGYNKMTLLQNANNEQKQAYDDNITSLKVELVKLNSGEININELQMTFRLIEKLELNKIAYLGAYSEIILAKALVGSKMAFFSNLISGN